MSKGLSNELEDRFANAINRLERSGQLTALGRIEIVALLRLGRESLRMEAQRFDAAITEADAAIAEYMQGAPEDNAAST